jgi:uncharacterized protein YybS (DUF2232 family)
MKSKLQNRGAIPGQLARIAPFFLPFVFFQSAIFMMLSPLPLFVLTLRGTLPLAFAALGSNLILTRLAGANSNELLVLGVFWFGVGNLFPLLIRKSGKIQSSLVYAFLCMILMFLGSLQLRAHEIGIGAVDYLRSEISIGMDHLINLPNSPVKKLVDEQGRDGLFRQLMTELPSGLLIALLLSLWVNLLFASQIVPSFLSKSFWNRFRNPEWLVWPTLGSAALYAFAEHAPYYIGLNLFKLLMVFYAFQGLSILGFLMTRNGIAGLGRILIFSVALFLALPLVLALGFFDLWFDFRKKFGQI